MTFILIYITKAMTSCLRQLTVFKVIKTDYIHQLFSCKCHLVYEEGLNKDIVMKCKLVEWCCRLLSLIMLFKNILKPFDPRILSTHIRYILRMCSRVNIL